ncbi:kinesin-like protein KIF22 isoform X3 [Cygnus olor]|uniref:kinesin-like protein KIF22 isoform X3 n=1 Tax=Cygnus olor TaxID=8869 RepID=UPI001ADEBDD4|nr:kinesin-like protein KIF22 isoform X3 [Cygnus olor]
MRTSSPPIGCRRAVSNGRAGAMAAEVAAAPPRRVQVCVRLRPGPPGEEPCLLPLDSHTLELREEPPSAPSRYRFDAIYGAASSTATVYEGSVRPLLSHLLAGRDVTVLAYGPSGSGKTHTMLGSEGEPGLVQRALEDVLEAVGDSRRVTVACMEVYCEEIRDLLCPGGPPLRILQARGGPPEVRGLTRLPLGPPPAPALLAASLGARRRAAPTLLNASSSRGHLVLWVRCDPPGTPPAPGGAPPPPTLTLADLAGLEDPRRSGAGGVRLREGGATNASLGVLRRVLGALRRGGRPPLRESRLTRLLGGAPRPPGPPLLLLLLALCPRPPGRPQARRALSFARGVRHVPPPPVGDEGGDATVASNAPEPRSPPSTPPPEDQALQRWLEDAENTLQRLKKRRPPPSPPPLPPPPPGAPSPASLVVLRRRQKGCPQWEAVAAPRLEAGVRAHVLRALNGRDPAQLRGLGPRRGGRIHAWRQEHGPFRTVEDLAAVPGFSAAQVATLLQVSPSSGGGPELSRRWPQAKEVTSKPPRWPQATKVTPSQGGDPCATKVSSSKGGDPKVPK